MLTGKDRGRVQYTPQQISNGLDLLVQKIAKIRLSAEIISPYFGGGLIHGKLFTVNIETMPLVIILQDAIRFHYGQLGRCYFDNQGRENNTASLVVLMDQIFNNALGDSQRKTIYKAEYNDIKSRLHKAEKYKRKLRKYCNKHFAHTDIQSPEAIEKDYVGLNIPWGEFINLIDDAKIILGSMYKVCEKQPGDFSEYVYESYKDQFWKLIDFPETKITKHL